MSRALRTSLLCACAVIAACDDTPDVAPTPGTPAPSESPRDEQDIARRDIHDAFKLAQRATKHASDGGGRAWVESLDGAPLAVTAGTTGRWRIVYEAGELGVARGGAVYFQVSPFFEWSTPQVEAPDAAGFTRIATEAEGVELSAKTLDQQLLGIELGGRELRAGERITIDYGCGPAGARVDPYAEPNSRFWIAVDGDGDGVRKVLADSPGIDVLPGPPAMLVATLTSSARAGEEVRLTLALLDARANAAGACAATLELTGAASELELPSSVVLGADDRGRKTLVGRAPADGVYRVQARAVLAERTLVADSNPLSVGPGPRVFWADFHGHTAVSDGSGTANDYFDFARNVAALDIAALTDHDHWGMLFVDEQPELWRAQVDSARRAHEPGRFVALPGYEWTSWLTGHRHVLYFGEQAPLFSSMDERYESPEQLRETLRDQHALIVPHHPAGGPIAIDWRHAPDPELEPVVEMCSAHGTSEALDCARVIHSPRPGHFARDALARGYRLGFVGSGDGHDGHPGLAWKGPHYPTGGLAAILADELTSDGVYRALRARRCYATSGPRILLRFALGRARMGEAIPAAEVNREGNLYLQVVGASALERIEVVVGASELLSIPCRNELEFSASATLSDLKPGEFVYVRVLQLDGGMAWSSPVFVE
ncbi:MAG: CehA/McbA family metallohydrolase [Planctomycetes bacterium]|nr:CehA/McbA family metallohydrolase [Planctomycetota bacterium]